MPKGCTLTDDGPLTASLLIRTGSGHVASTARCVVRKTLVVGELLKARCNATACMSHCTSGATTSTRGSRHWCWAVTTDCSHRDQSGPPWRPTPRLLWASGAKYARGATHFAYKHRHGVRRRYPIHAAKAWTLIPWSGLWGDRHRERACPRVGGLRKAAAMLVRSRPRPFPRPRHSLSHPPVGAPDPDLTTGTGAAVGPRRPGDGLAHPRSRPRQRWGVILKTGIAALNAHHGAAALAGGWAATSVC